MEVVSQVLPFRVNRYVIEQLIDWKQVPEDPIFQLTFPQPGMLSPEHFRRVSDAMDTGDRAHLAREVDAVRRELNPHPAGQMEHNVPRPDGKPLRGVQHKYAETVLFFPARGQTCHSYCSFCFRWAQFIGDTGLRFSGQEISQLHRYLRSHLEVNDLLITGGDPMVMKTRHLGELLDGLLTPGLEHVRDIRIGTKSLSFWPYRYVTDPDADELLRLFERVVESGRHLSLMAHVNHWRELETPIAREAIRRIRDTGAVIRTQAPLLAHVNDDPHVWNRLWRTQVRLGMVPYYMFVERDTGARHYFEVPLVRAWNIYREAASHLSGLARTVRGPSMSAAPGKVEVLGVEELQGEKVFVLRFLQARDPGWCYRPFFARFDERATWLDQLEPAFGEPRFFFQ
ncbi:MAG: lysine 2,3-aminomutase [Gammaproteobacteria bacterium]|nr:MAG: lysine 2,3-aminomutase [Gammaproteobacteria bacterium]